MKNLRNAILWCRNKYKTKHIVRLWVKFLLFGTCIITAEGLWRIQGYKTIASYMQLINIFGMLYFNYLFWKKSFRFCQNSRWKWNGIHLRLAMLDYKTRGDFDIEAQFCLKSKGKLLSMIMPISKTNLNDFFEMVNKRPHRIYQLWILNKKLDPIETTNICATSIHEMFTKISKNPKYNDKINHEQLNLFLQNLEIIYFCTSVLKVLPNKREFFIHGNGSQKPIMLVEDCA